jgi:hypothetical protein
LLDLAEREHVPLVIFGHDGQQWLTTSSVKLRRFHARREKRVLVSGGEGGGSTFVPQRQEEMRRKTGRRFRVSPGTQ